MKKFNSVLLIDDDDINNYIIDRLFNRLNLCDKFTVLKNGEQGMAFIKEQLLSSTMPDLILIDIHMPVMSGMEFLESLKKLVKEWSSLTIIPISNAVHSSELRQLQEMGFADVLLKPLTEDKLLLHLNSELQRNAITKKGNQ